MGIKEESVNISWARIPASVKVMLIAILLFLFALVRIPLKTVYVGYHGLECYGTCDISYAISADQLIIDRINNKTGKEQHETINGEFGHLKFGVPLLLLLHPTNFGCPDCDDSGAHLLGFSLFGIKFNYALEPGKEPWYFQDMDDKIRSRLKEIEEISPME